MNQQPPDDPNQHLQGPLQDDGQTVPIFLLLPPEQPLQNPLPPQHSNVWQRYRSAHLKIRLGIGCSLLLVLALLFSLLVVTLSGGDIQSIFSRLTAPFNQVPGKPGATTPYPGQFQPPRQHFESPFPSPVGTLSPLPPTQITADFASRQNHAYPLSNNLLGLNGLNHISRNSQLLSYLAPAHLNLVRVSVDMTATFPTPASVSPQQQNWSVLDTLMGLIQAQGLHPILIVSYSPAWLQPQNNPCNQAGGDPSHVKPTSLQNGNDVGIQLWGTLAAQVVAHMDQKFPSIHPEYEIWNEPDGVTFLCEPASDPNADQTRLTTYKAIFAVAAARMKQQAQQDGVQIHVGGPALAVPRIRASTWIPALVNDPTTAPYIDFISYHNYHGGNQGDTWASLLASTQDPNSGVAAIFEYVSSAVRNGRQPNAQSTPIYIDEYSTNVGTPDCCRNDRTFGPLWNAVFVIDLLNSVNDTQSANGPAQAPVGGLTYFTATEPPPSNEFCLFGTWNAAMDCSLNGQIQPYPQYYLYQLLGDPRFLDITNNGYVISAPVVKATGLITCAFYSNTKDSMLFINTGATAYTQMTVGLQNPGGRQAATVASVYTLNAANPQIATQQMPASAFASGSIATINIPPYSIVALSLPVIG